MSQFIALLCCVVHTQKKMSMRAVLLKGFGGMHIIKVPLNYTLHYYFIQICTHHSNTTIYVLPFFLSLFFTS